MKMLLHYTGFCVSMLVVSELCQALSKNQCYESIISPNPKEIIVNEGETLQTSCCGTINFISPGNRNIFVKQTSDYFIYQNVSNSIPVYTFEKPKTVLKDTGWYGCADSDNEIVNFSNPEVNWLYVYVTSNSSAFIEENTRSYLTISAIVGDNVDIPCRTTSPNLQPILINSKGDEVYKVSYNPKFGFTINNISLDDSGKYKCLIKTDKKEHMVTYVLSVDPKISTKPKIQTYDLSIEREPMIYINCTAEMEISVRYVFDWNMRQQNISWRNTQQLSKRFNRYSVLVNFLKLTKFEVREQKLKDYECNTKTNYEVLTNYQKKTKEIMISYHQRENIIFSLIMKIEYTYISEDTEWRIYIKVYIMTDKYIESDILQWFKPNGEEITKSNQKYSITSDFLFNLYVKSSIKQSSLRIKSLNILDSGNYRLQIRNKYDITKNLTVKLDIIDKPISVLTAFELSACHYQLNETKEFRCNVISNPTPNITWNFLKCPNYPSLKNSTIIHLTNVTQSTAYNSSYRFESIAKMLINVSGKLTCKACNEIGCNSVTENILVPSELEAFGIIGPKEPVMKGDNIELVCASIYNNTYEFTWSRLVNQTEQSLEETGRSDVKNNTSFTHRSTLKLYNVQESDATNYVCIRKIVNTLNNEILCSLYDRVNYELVIHEPVPPYFIKTNINKTKTRIIDMNTEEQNTTILNCHVDGMPKPKVIWYKDNELLKENDQYFFKNNYQELHIKYFMQHDSGTYLCQAVNRIGINETHQQIIIKNSKWHTLDIVLVTSVSILGFILIISTISYAIKIDREKRKRKELIEAGFLNFEAGALEYLNSKLTIDEQAELLPYDKKWEFPRYRLKLREQLGSGNFGLVMKAEAIGICKNEDITTVAVKMVRRHTDPIYIRALVSELKIMVHLGKHLNIVNLLGACTTNISKCKLLVIVEYCRFGNLHNYLLRHRNNFINQINPKTRKHDFTIGMDLISRNINNDSSPIGNSNIDVMMHNCPETNSDSPEINFLPDCVLSDDLSQLEWRSNYCNDVEDQNTKPICTQDLLSWAFQVARGMEYLSQRKILHGDLAARNILIAENNIAKICDFGFAKTMYKEDIYKKKSSVPMPIKWMAVESIRNKIFSTQSDVWSFGIMLWEFFTLAEIPYPSVDIMILHQRLIEGYRMAQPDYAVDEIYDIMLQCWIAKPTLRPSFTNLVECIGNLLEEGVKMHYITLNNPYMDINMMNLKNGEDDYLMMTSAPDYAILSLPTYKRENSLSKETINSTYLYMKSDCSPDKSNTFNPRPHDDHSNIEPLSPTSDSEEANDLSPMSEHKENPSEADQYP